MNDKAFPPITPGEVLLEEFLRPMGISQYRLAKSIGVPPRRINEIVHGKRRITPDTGVRIAKALGMSERFFLDLQLDYDLAVEKEAHQEEFDAIVPLVT
ncbi:HigA family addiction module antitoxin [Microbacterium halotolerans]|uniref:HigA family addiction module antitoxin n=1 Tax=Microbacterium halotolerans TaxID=246613 RepID=UPI000E6A9DC3|nr:HigA family addiction module antitoxin [Microbacterium halotolerans]